MFNRLRRFCRNMRTHRPEEPLLEEILDSVAETEQLISRSYACVAEIATHDPDYDERHSRQLVNVLALSVHTHKLTLLRLQSKEDLRIRTADWEDMISELNATKLVARRQLGALQRRVAAVLADVPIPAAA